MEKETFESILKDKLGNHELPVDPALWKSVSAQAGLSSGSAGLGLGTWLGIASSIVAVAVGVVYFTLSNESPTTANLEKNTVQKSTKVPNNANTPKELSEEQKKNAHAGKLINDPIMKSDFGTLEEGPQSVNIAEADVLVLPNNESSNTIKPLEPIKAPTPATIIANICLKPIELTETSPTEKPSVKKMIVMPNAITPNGDGINDVLSLDSDGLTDFNVVVLDVANNLVYSSTDPNFKWNGTLLNGDPAPAGTYQYYFTAKDENGMWCNQFSSLTILR